MKAISLVMLLCLALAPATLTAAQPACKVIDPELQGAYQGGCRHGLAHGNGVAKGVATYKGEFRDGLKDGHGVKAWPWGDRYEGEFKADRKDGHGVYVWGENTAWAGERYDGQYKEDARDGWGIYTWPNGDKYEGPWAKDQRLGFSVFEIRRQEAATAQQDAFKPGVTVCSLRVARDTGQVITGTVDSFDGTVLRVKLAQFPQGSELTRGAVLEPGQVLADAPLDWAPCM